MSEISPRASAVCFNGALPIQVGKLVPAADPVPYSPSFNGALPIQVGKPAAAFRWIADLFPLQWSPTHSGRETWTAISECECGALLQWSPTHSGRETIIQSVRIVEDYALQWSPTHSGRETRISFSRFPVPVPASMEPYPFR